MMVDLGGGAREHLQNASAEESEEPLPPISSVGYAHPVSRPASWRSTFQEQDTPDPLNLVESVPHNLIQVKSDPENLSGLCIGNSSSLSETPVSCAEAAEDARAKGQLLQEITHVAETFEPYSSSLPPGCYRNYTLSSDAPAHTDYIYTPHWCWSRSSTDDKTLSGHNGGSLFTGTVPSNETVINSLQYNVPPHLMSDAFSSSLPPVSVNQSPTSVPNCSPIQKPPPPPPPLSALTSSALDLSPGPPSTTHQLPSLQPSLLTPASTHMTTLGSVPPSTHQLPNLPPSLISLEIPSQALSAQDTLDNTLDLVGVEESASHERVPEFECGECGAVFSRLPHLKYHMKIHGEVEKSDKQDFTTDSSNSKFRVQSSEKVFPCKHCGEKFSRAEKLKTHEVKHSGNRPFRCNDCGAAFPAKAMLIRHKKWLLN
ncbi:Zinc finger protein 519 [Portunus trituberculatus]|uniref:Zinc finger protein 519 n=1 Tax=Portunus trituberculatus TaxID=210409 RepID=A0A5B7DMV7_PORTR|nr:Zinc finger protein 519 [Portunus trituberculatus]